VFGGVAEGFAGVAELGAGAALELGAEVFDALSAVAEDARGLAAFEGVAEFVEVLLAVAEDARGLAAIKALLGLLEFFAAPLKALAGEALEAGVEFGEGVGGGEGGCGDLFGGGAGCGGAEVSGEVGNGEVDFVADSADDGKFGGDDGAGGEFFVEGPEVFEAAAAAGEEDEVEGTARRDAERDTRDACAPRICACAPRIFGGGWSS
jgi:hypothetical protein